MNSKNNLKTTGGWPEYSPRTEYPEIMWVYYLPVTMRRLRAPRRPGEPPLKVLFYGDSVVASNWGAVLLKLLAERYPSARFENLNLAIGGFNWRLLKRYAYNDILPAYPDLVVLSSWGNDMGGPHAEVAEAYYSDLEELLLLIRSNTTAEIMLLTYHQLPGKNQLFGRQAEPSMEAIRLLAGKYGCEMVDMLEGWRAHLKKSGTAVEDYLCDAVHLNAAGQLLMARLALSHFKSVLPCADEIVSGRITRHEAEQALEEVHGSGINISGGDWRTPEGASFAYCPGASSAGYLTASRAGSSVSLEFVGNRVDILFLKGKGGGSADITIDGLPPSRLGLFSAARAAWDPENANPTPHLARGTNIKRITVGLKPAAEDWTMTVLNDAGDFAFTGSLTGDGGCGNIHERFEARERRFNIDQHDFFDQLKKGERFYFKIAAEHEDFLDCAGPAEPAPARITAAKFLAPGKHRLEIRARGNGLVRLDALEVFEPPRAALSIYSPARKTGDLTRAKSAEAQAGILKNFIRDFSGLKSKDAAVIRQGVLHGMCPATWFLVKVAQGGRKEFLLMIDAQAECCLPVLAANAPLAGEIQAWSQGRPEWEAVAGRGRRLTALPVRRRWNIVRGLPADVYLLDITSRTSFEGNAVDLVEAGWNTEWLLSLANPLPVPLGVKVRFMDHEPQAQRIKPGEEKEWRKRVSCRPEIFPLGATLECSGGRVFIDSPVEIIRECECRPAASGPVPADWDAQLWKGRPANGPFYITGSKALAQTKPTFFKLAYDHKALWILARCCEPDMRQTVVQAESGRMNFGADHLELFLQPAQTQRYVQLAADSAGGRWNDFGDYKPGLKAWGAVARRGKQDWSVLFRIPFALLPDCPAAGSCWRFNMARWLTTAPASEKSTCWARLTEESFCQAERFGILRFR